MATARANPRRTCITMALSIILHAGFAASFTAVRSHTRATSSLFPNNVSISFAHSDNAAAATPNNNLFALRDATSRPRRTSNVLSALLRLISGMKRSISRALAILSFAFLATVSNSRPAFAWGKTAEASVTKVEAPTNTNKKCVKFIVTVGAVAAGAASASKVRGLNLNATDDQTDEAPVVEIKAEQPRTVKEPPKQKPKSYPTVSNVPLVKDLDAKIERLREQERLAVQHAKDNIERGAAEKAEQMAKAAAESEKNRVEEQIAKIAEEEANKIAAIQKERDEQSKIAKAKIAAVEKERLERIAAEQEALVNQMKIEQEMKHKVTQSSEPSHADESRILVETDAAKRKEQDRMMTEKYASITTEEERAFNILVDLGMVELHPDEFGDKDDDNIDPANVFL